MIPCLTTPAALPGPAPASSTSRTGQNLGAGQAGQFAEAFASMLPAVQVQGNLGAASAADAETADSQPGIPEEGQPTNVSSDASSMVLDRAEAQVPGFQASVASAMNADLVMSQRVQHPSLSVRESGISETAAPAETTALAEAGSAGVVPAQLQLNPAADSAIPAGQLSGVEAGAESTSRGLAGRTRFPVAVAPSLVAPLPGAVGPGAVSPLPVAEVPGLGVPLPGVVAPEVVSPLPVVVGPGVVAPLPGAEVPRLVMPLPGAVAPEAVTLLPVADVPLLTMTLPEAGGLLPIAHTPHVTLAVSDLPVPPPTQQRAVPIQTGLVQEPTLRPDASAVHPATTAEQRDAASRPAAPAPADAATATTAAASEASPVVVPSVYPVSQSTPQAFGQAGAQVSPADPAANAGIPNDVGISAVDSLEKPAAESPLVRTQAPAPLHRQMLGPIATLAAGPNGERTLSVNIAPEALGPVTVKALLGGEGIRMELSAPTDAGREALRAMLPELRRELAAMGSGIITLSTGSDSPATTGGHPGSQGAGGSDARPFTGTASPGLRTRDELAPETQGQETSLALHETSHLDVMA